MSFSWDIKEKLCTISGECPYCIRAEIAGIVGFSGEFSENLLRLMTEQQTLADRIVHDLKECIGIEAKQSGEKTKKILITDKTVLDNLRACLFLDDEQTEKEFDEEIL